MTREDFQSFLREYKFHKYADIVSNGSHAYFDICQINCSDNGYVYLWAEEDEFSVNAVYVGKAGRTMKRRCDQHLSGFRGGSSTGKSHSDRILVGISTSKSYCVYARKSCLASILGEKKISMCTVEELALIKKLKPNWSVLKNAVCRPRKH